MCYNKSNRKYIAKVYRSKIYMPNAVIELSANAFKLLNLIYFEILTGENLQDKIIMEYLGISRKPYYRAKEELKSTGYIKIVQVGSTYYKWYLGKDAIKKDNEKYQNKTKKDLEKYAKLVLNGHDNQPSQKTFKVDDGIFVLEGFEQNEFENIVT